MPDGELVWSRRRARPCRLALAALVGLASPTPVLTPVIAPEQLVLLLRSQFEVGLAVHASDQRTDARVAHDQLHQSFEARFPSFAGLAQCLLARGLHPLNEEFVLLTLPLGRHRQRRPTSGRTELAFLGGRLPWIHASGITTVAGLRSIVLDSHVHPPRKQRNCAADARVETDNDWISLRQDEAGQHQAMPSPCPAEQAPPLVVVVRGTTGTVTGLRFQDRHVPTGACLGP